jgi:transcriptional regulator with XRE-family HTH domain
MVQLMTLDAYLRSVGKTHAQFADAVGISESSVSRYCSGKIIPSKQVMKRIREVTGGKVTADDFYTDKSDQDHAANVAA